MNPWVALYKAYRGGEWFELSLESIKDHVDHIMVIHCERAWVDTDLPNNCYRPLKRWWNRNHQMSIFGALTGLRTQDNIYREGYEAVVSRFPGCYILLIDTDEIWDPDQLGRLKEYVLENPHAAYACRLYTYVKSIYYRVFPLETCSPVVVIDTDRAVGIEGPRGMRIPDKVVVPYVMMHHMTYVRADERDIRLKLRTSAAGDGVPSREDWMDAVWAQLPFVRNFHPSIGYAHCWQTIQQITAEDLPAVVREELIRGGKI